MSHEVIKLCFDKVDEINKCDCKLISPDCVCQYKSNDTGMQYN